MVLIMSLYCLGWMVAVCLSLEYMRMRRQLALAAVAAIFGSARRAETSFMIVAPAWIAASATAAEVVSMEMGALVLARRVWIKGIVRASSSFVEIFLAFGAVDWPPMSMMSAPSFRSLRACFRAFSGVLCRPPSLKESGVVFRMARR